MQKRNKGAEKTDDERLSNIFSGAGKQYGLEEVTARFVAFRDLKIRWQRSYKMADFMVSDYLNDAPEEVLWDFADTIIAKAFTDDRGDYARSVVEWITSERFRERKQPVYLGRSRNLTRSPVGTHKNLTESYGRLVDSGLAEEDPGLCLSWTKNSASRKMGHCSVIMGVIAISGALDDVRVPDDVLDYCVYHELCHLKIGFDPSGGEHDRRFPAMEALYPKKAEAAEWLRHMDMFV